MNQSSKNARTRLKKSTRKEFESLVYEAMLTPIQERVLRLHIADGVGVPMYYFEKEEEAGSERERRAIQEALQKM